MKTHLNPFIFCSLLLSLAAPSAQATVFHWDGNNTTAAADGGAGTWDTITTNWNDAATAGASITWPADGGIDNDASFRGTAGSVTVDAAGITVNDLTFGTTGYTISEGGLTLNGGTLPAINVTGTATINSPITGTTVAGGFNKTGTGTLVLGGANTFTAPTTMVFGAAGQNTGNILLTNSSALSGITLINATNVTNAATAQFQLAGGVTVAGTNINTGGRTNQQTNGAVLVNNSGNNEWGGFLSITLTGGAFGIRSDAGTLTLSGSLRSNIASRAWDVGGAGDVLISGIVGGTTGSANSNTMGLNKFGAGTLTISGTGNTFAGTTRINAGTILLTSATALVNSTVDMNTADTGALSVGPSLTAVSLGGLSGVRNLSLLNTAATPAPIFLTLGSANNSTYTGLLSGVTNFYKVGTGTFTLNPGAAASLSLNALSANAGTIVLLSGNISTTGIDPGQAAYAMGAGARGGTLTINGANLTVGGTRRFVIGAAANGTGNMINGSLTSDSVVLGHNGTTTMTQSGGTITTNSIYHQDAGAGTYTLTGGTLIARAIYNSTANTTGGQSFTLNLNGGTLQARAGTTNLITNANTAGTQIAVLLGTGNTQIDTSVTSATITRPLGNMSGQVGTFTKIGANTLTLTGANNYSGATTVNAGTLSVNASALGSRGVLTSGNTATFSPVTVTPSGEGVTSATLELNGATVNAVATLNGTGTGGNAASLINSNTGTSAVLDTGVLGMTFTSTGTTWNLASQTTSPLSITGGGATTDATANVNLATTTGTFTASDGTGWVTGNTLTVSGGGSTQSAVYTVTATAGAITGLTQTQAGIGFTTLTGLTYTGAKGTAVPTFAGVGGTFAGVDSTFTLSSIALATNGRGYTGSGTITSTDGGGTFTGSTPATVPSLTLVGTQNQIGGAGNLTINTVVGGSGGGFSKIGAGTVTLSGTNTYTGGTTISAGSLLVTNTTGSATGTGAVTVTGGLLGGTGSVAGNVTIAAGARLDPGTTTGTLTVGGTVSGEGTAALQLADAGSDKLVAGGITPSALTLELSVTGTLTADAYVLVDSASAPASPFVAVTGIPSGYSLSYSYNDGVDSNNIALVKESGSSPFQNWAGTTHGLSGPDAEPGADPDFDGLSNLVEFVIGGNPKASGDSLPTATVNGANMVFTFPRTDLSLTEPSLTSAAEYSTTLDAWTPAVDGTDGVSIVVTDDGIGTGVDKVQVSVPLSLSTSGKLFSRLKVTKP